MTTFASRPASPPRADPSAPRGSGDAMSLPLRPVEIWLPDTKSAAFREAAAEQSRRIAAADDEDEVMRFIEAVIDLDDDG